MNTMRWLIAIGLGLVLVTTLLVIAVPKVGNLLDNGEMIAFQSSESGKMNIYLRDGRTGFRYNLTGQRGRHLPANDETNSTYIPRYATMPQSLSPQGDDVLPVWSPDGTYLAFVSRRDGNPEIYVLNLHTGRLQNVSNYPGADSSPAWSPDGRQIAFQSRRGPYWNIYIVDLASGETHNLTDATRDDFNPVWAPRP
jgi:Tol biopolymer transport system component